MTDLSPSLDVTRRRSLLRGSTAGRWQRNLSGYAFGWPWFDGLSSWALRRFFFPASRLWAAAQVANGSPERFYQAAGIARSSNDNHLARTLARIETLRARALAMEAEWQRVFFGPADTAAAYRAAVEAARLDASHEYNSARRLFGRWLLRGVPPIRLETQSPDEVAAVYGERARDFARVAAAPATMPPIEVSRTVPAATGLDYWLRFRSPSSRLGDSVYARVHEPIGVSDPPTIIMGHGICVEFENWHGLIHEANTLCAAGFRVIRPEAPWHGRRTPPGNFGGERLVTHFPAALLDAFAGALQEWAVLADWSRRTSRGSLAFGGTSLGAQMAQLAADCATDGPEHLRPEGLFLVTHCGRMTDATVHGEMTEIFGTAHDVRAKGWTHESLDAVLGRLDPSPRPPVPAERIVSVIGSRDRVTPFGCAVPLIDAWKVPAANRFIWDRGHFSMPMTLIRNARPVERFREVMARRRD
jgi:pimeloyl-ACP methyl ester carboxylesterase